MFFVFEGLDGCGKSTLIQNFKVYLESLGKEVYVTREPGGTPLGEELRSTLLVIKENKEFKISPRAELLLYEASRAQHVEQIIKPKVEQGVLVLCDRFTASSVAFQAGGRALKGSDVEWLNDFATNNYKPRAQVFIDLDFKACQERKKKMSQSLDRLESESEKFHTQVYESYKQQTKNHPSDWIVLDGHNSPNALLDQFIYKLKSEKGIQF